VRNSVTGCAGFLSSHFLVDRLMQTDE